MSLRSQLIEMEGTRHTVYTDSTGHITFGVGHSGNTPLSILAINQILTDDIQNAVADVVQAMPWAEALSVNRFNVLVNMTFNMGIGGLMKFKHMIAALQNALDNAGDYNAVATAMLDSKWARQVGPRAERLAQQMITDVEQ